MRQWFESFERRDFADLFFDYVIFGRSAFGHAVFRQIRNLQQQVAHGIGFFVHQCRQFFGIVFVACHFGFGFVGFGFFALLHQCANRFGQLIDGCQFGVEFFLRCTTFTVERNNLVNHFGRRREMFLSQTTNDFVAVPDNLFQC